MVSDEEIKEAVRQRYAEAARRGVEAVRSCCSQQERLGAVCRKLYTEEQVAMVPAEAITASAGCGNPVTLAELRPGEVVLDLGCGGGIDALLSARRVGPTGKVYGLDMTDEMLELARENQRRAGVTNVEFLRGEMEDIPLPGRSVDVIISNCVINLSPDKDRVLQEAYRVLKPGGRIALADIVARGEMPAELRRDLALWAGCVAGALSEEEYREKLAAAGFVSIDVETVGEYTTNDPGGLGKLPRQSANRGAERPGFASAIVRARKP